MRFTALLLSISLTLELLGCKTTQPSNSEDILEQKIELYVGEDLPEEYGIFGVAIVDEALRQIAEESGEKVGEFHLSWEFEHSDFLAADGLMLDIDANGVEKSIVVMVH